MKKLSIILTTVLVFAGATVINAQADYSDTNVATHLLTIDIPTVALVDVEDATGEATTIDLSPTFGALEAGEAVDFSSATDNSLWLNYTSLVGTGAFNKVTVALATNSPSGSTITLTAAADAGNGGGTTGSANVATVYNLSTTASDIVSNIGSCYTGDGVNNGHNLTYSLVLSDLSTLEAISGYSTTVTYTITGQ